MFSSFTHSHQAYQDMLFDAEWSVSVVVTPPYLLHGMAML
jgi:hypothetical protein